MPRSLQQAAAWRTGRPWSLVSLQTGQPTLTRNTSIALKQAFNIGFGGLEGVQVPHKHPRVDCLRVLRVGLVADLNHPETTEIRMDVMFFSDMWLLATYMEADVTFACRLRSLLNWRSSEVPRNAPVSMLMHLW